jgi:hypothetical protein
LRLVVIENIEIIGERQFAPQLCKEKQKVEEERNSRAHISSLEPRLSKNRNKQGVTEN